VSVLLVEPDRTLGRHRLYPIETVTVLRVIKAAQRLGFSLQEVADLITQSLITEHVSESQLRESIVELLDEAA
jgi:DNA-binding transcriptional MerR regulator